MTTITTKLDLFITELVITAQKIGNDEKCWCIPAMSSEESMTDT